ncbi:MAG: DUF4252 domain-containing protein [Bacteroidales bacterium]|nr:DUF4252 domain-containing protein [Bacteroidales bacterium]
MKKLKLIVLISVFPLLVFSQHSSVNKLFEKYAEKDGFTTVYISKNLFKMVGEMDLDDPEVDGLVDKLETIKILASDSEFINEDGLNFYKEIMDELPIEEYDELLVVKEKDQDVKFLSKEKNGIITELLLVVGGKDNNALICITGNIDLKHISKLASSMEGTGMEYLEKLEEEEK